MLNKILTLILLILSLTLFAQTGAEDIQIVKGVVTAIHYGGDGYTAEVETINKEIYQVTISIPNLGPDNEFIQFEIGDEVEVQGEYWKMGDVNQLTVRKIITEEDNLDSN